MIIARSLEKLINISFLTNNTFASISRGHQLIGVSLALISLSDNYSFVLFWACICAFATLKMVIELFWVASYECIHAMANLGLSLVTYSDMVHVLLQPLKSTELSSSRALVCVSSLHFFHILQYWPLSFEDIVHHFLMVGVCIPYSMYIGVNKLSNYLVFFITGLPGCISYLFVFLAKNKFVSKKTSITVHALVSSLIRAPFIVIGGYVGLLGYLKDTNLNWPWLPVALLVALNGIYYNLRAVKTLVTTV